MNIRVRAVCAFAVGAVLALAGGGCGKAANHVNGIVSYDGKPLKSGTIVFHDSEGKDQYAAIGPAGEYQIANVAEGDAHIAIIRSGPVPEGFRSTPRPKNSSR